MKTKICFRCKNEQLLSEFYKNKTKKDGLHLECKSCAKKRLKQWNIDNREHIKDQHYRRMYGITLEKYNQMLIDQNHKCIGCDKDELEVGKLFVDHDHVTGKVRGLLCCKCNFILGQCNDNPKILLNLINYLKKRNDYPQGVGLK